MAGDGGDHVIFAAGLLQRAGRGDAQAVAAVVLDLDFCERAADDRREALGVGERLAAFGIENEFVDARRLSFFCYSCVINPNNELS